MADLIGHLTHRYFAKIMNHNIPIQQSFSHFFLLHLLSDRGTLSITYE